MLHRTAEKNAARMGECTVSNSQSRDLCAKIMGYYEKIAWHEDGTRRLGVHVQHTEYRGQCHGRCVAARCSFLHKYGTMGIDMLKSKRPVQAVANMGVGEFSFGRFLFALHTRLFDWSNSLI